eukprot:c21299_g1_i7 orf=657-989(+)
MQVHSCKLFLSRGQQHFEGLHISTPQSDYSKCNKGLRQYEAQLSSSDLLWVLPIYSHCKVYTGHMSEMYPSQVSCITNLTHTQALCSYHKIEHFMLCAQAIRANFFLEMT